MWFAMKVFGSGFGMGAPYFDQEFLWLVDMAGGVRRRRSGRFYAWIGGFGAQLCSFEWRRPPEGGVRNLAGEDFVLFSAFRGRFGLMWNCAWAFDRTLDAEEIRALKGQMFGVTAR